MDNDVTTEDILHVHEDDEVMVHVKVFNSMNRH